MLQIYEKMYITLNTIFRKHAAIKDHLAITLLLISAALLLLPTEVVAQGGGDGNPGLKIPQEPLKRWRSLRVGAFIHWSPQVLRGLGDPKEFRAEKFDPGQWVQIFKE